MLLAALYLNETTMKISQSARGLLFIWIPLLPFITKMIVILKGSQQAVGIAAVAGGGFGGRYFAIFLSVLFLLAISASEIYGILLLVRTLSARHLMRSLVAIVSISVGALFLIAQGALATWFMRFN